MAQVADQRPERKKFPPDIPDLDLAARIIGARFGLTPNVAGLIADLAWPSRHFASGSEYLVDAVDPVVAVGE
jgi:hypothetical protein